MSSKKKTGPKNQQLENINRKAFLAMNRAGALQNGYMNLSAAIIETVKAVDEGKKTAEEGLQELAAHWRYIDGSLAITFQNIDNAVKKQVKSKREDWEGVTPKVDPIIDEVKDV